MNDKPEAGRDSPPMPARLHWPSTSDLARALLSLVPTRATSERRQQLAGVASADSAVNNLGHVTNPDSRGPSLAADTARPSLDEGAPFVADSSIAAFFDVDNTLIQGASIIHLARGLARHKFFTTKDLAGFAWQQIKFRVSGREDADDVASGREKALQFVKGRRIDEIVRLSEEIFDDSVMERVWPGTHALAQMHLDAGQQVWLVTATPVELARVISSRLGLTGALGTVAESHDGVYTGKLVGDILHGPGKAHAVRALAEREGLDLSKCYAYSDSHNDVPMLSLVGTAVAINPDAALRGVAKQRGWVIKDFRTMRRAAKIGVRSALVFVALSGTGAAIASDRGFRSPRNQKT